jgi:hypothetical protein
LQGNSDDRAESSRETSFQSAGGICVENFVAVIGAPNAQMSSRARGFVSRKYSIVGPAG